jgi:hypothetical protein
MTTTVVVSGVKVIAGVVTVNAITIVVGIVAGN